MKKSEHGFTLVELMIVVAIIGIVAMIAYPSYNQHILKTHRIEGKDLLTRAAALQERYFADNNTYTSDMTDLGFSSDPASTEHAYYSVDVDPASATCPITSCYSLSATATGSQASDTQCATITVTSTGRKTATNTNCW